LPTACLSPLPQRCPAYALVPPPPACVLPCYTVSTTCTLITAYLGWLPATPHYAPAADACPCITRCVLPPRRRITPLPAAPVLNALPQFTRCRTAAYAGREHTLGSHCGSPAPTRLPAHHHSSSLPPPGSATSGTSHHLIAVPTLRPAAHTFSHCNNITPFTCSAYLLTATLALPAAPTLVWIPFALPPHLISFCLLLGLRHLSHYALQRRIYRHRNGELPAF